MIKEFKPNKEEKRIVCNFIKNEIKNKEYYSVNILYSPEDGTIKLVDNDILVKTICKGNIFYNSFRYFKGEGDIGLREIESKVFNR